MKKSLDNLWFPNYENTQMFTKGLNYQRDILEFSLNKLPKDKFNLALDIGAHVGIMSLNLAKYFQKVVAFEPIHFEILKRNVEEHKVNVDIYNVPLADRQCGVEFEQPREENSGYIVPSELLASSGEAPEGLMAYPLDTFELAPDFIKIDVEGFELRVLKGAKQTILQHKPYILFEAKGLGELEGNTNAPWEYLKNECGYTNKYELDGSNALAIP